MSPFPTPTSHSIIKIQFVNTQYAFFYLFLGGALRGRSPLPVDISDKNLSFYGRSANK
jgi:hypothetical protein